jgi:hypothetical protein
VSLVNDEVRVLAIWSMVIVAARWEWLYVRVSSEKDRRRTMWNGRTITTSPSVCETPAWVFVTTAAVFVMRASVFVMSTSVFVTIEVGSANVASVHEMTGPVFVAFAGRSETVAAVHFREGLRSVKPASGYVTVGPGFATVPRSLEKAAPVRERVGLGPEMRPSVPEMMGLGPETTARVLVTGALVPETAAPGFIMTHPGLETMTASAEIVATGAEMVATGAERVSSPLVSSGYSVPRRSTSCASPPSTRTTCSSVRASCGIRPDGRRCLPSRP